MLCVLYALPLGKGIYLSEGGKKKKKRKNTQLLFLTEVSMATSTSGLTNLVLVMVLNM